MVEDAAVAAAVTPLKIEADLVAPGKRGAGTGAGHVALALQGRAGLLQLSANGLELLAGLGSLLCQLV